MPSREAKQAALEAQAAIALVLARHSGSLWPDEIRTLNSALGIVQRLGVDTTQPGC